MHPRNLLPLLFIFSTGALADDTITPGLYKSTIQTEMSMGDMQMPGRTMEQQECITAEDIAKGPPMAEPEDGDCEMVEYEFGGGDISMEMVCRMQGGEGRMVGTGTYTSDSFNMVNEFDMEAQGMKMKMRSTVNGKRVRDC